MAERYELQYVVLVDQFLRAVEFGADWLELKPLLNEMKKVCVCLECIEGFSRPVSSYTRLQC